MNPWAKNVSSIGLSDMKCRTIVITMVWNPKGFPYRKTPKQWRFLRDRKTIRSTKVFLIFLMSWFKYCKIFKSHCVFRIRTGRRLSTQSMMLSGFHSYFASFERWRFFGHGLIMWKHLNLRREKLLTQRENCKPLYMPTFFSSHRKNFNLLWEAGQTLGVRTFLFQTIVYEDLFSGDQSHKELKVK